MSGTSASGRLRILVVAAGEPWPLDGGGRLHLYHVLTQLVRHAEVTLLLPRPALHQEHLPPGLRVAALPRCPTTPASHSPRELSLTLRLVRRHFGHDEALEHWLRRHAVRSEYDVVMLNGAALGRHIDACRVPVVWNPQDELVLPILRAAQYSSYARWPAALRHSLLYAAYERYVARRAAAAIYVSRLDAAYARRWVGEARLEVVQNGVDFEAFAPVADPPEPGTVAFIGALDFPPNIDAVRHFVATAWPSIHAGDGRRRLRIVGRRPVPAVRALADVPGVEVIPDVPDVRPYLARAAAVIVPIRTGGGLKNKVLEACAMRRPVVAHPRALAGLTVRVGSDVLSASRPESWIRCVTRLLDEPDCAARLARNGYDWVTRAHGWEATGRRFLEILSSAVEMHSRKKLTKSLRRPGTPLRRDSSNPRSTAGGREKIVSCWRHFKTLVKTALYARSARAAWHLHTTRIGSAEIRLPGFPGAFRLRTGTSDARLLRSLLFETMPREYDCPLPRGPQVILDIGANIGTVTAALARRYPEARIYAFEPAPENVELLRHNTRRFERVTVLPYGLGDRTTFMPYTRSDDPRNFGGGGFHGGSRGSNEQAARLPVVAVPEALARLGIRKADLIKVDTEGAEHAILTSFPAEILEAAQAIVGELHGKAGDGALLEYLSRRCAVKLIRSRGVPKWFQAFPRAPVARREPPSLRQSEAEDESAAARR